MIRDTYRDMWEFEQLELVPALGDDFGDYDIEAMADALVDAGLVEHDPCTGATRWAEAREGEPDFWEIAKGFDVRGVE